MKLKIFLMIGGILLVKAAQAQNDVKAQNVTISVEYLKGNTYTQSLDSRSHTVTTYTGNAVHLNELKAKGLKNPTVSDKNLQLKCTTKCMNMAGNGKMPIHMQFTKALSGSMHLPTNYSAPIHLHKYPGKQPVVDSISQKMKPEQYKSQWLPMIQTMLGQMDFISKRMTVGSEAREQTVQQFPVNGKAYSILVTTTYVLKKVTTDSAWLDINSSFALKNPKEVRVAVKGTGKGMMVYDVKNHVISRRSVSSRMDIQVIQGNISAQSVEENIINEIVKIGH